MPVFPTSPTNGQEYVDGSRTFQYVDPPGVWQVLSDPTSAVARVPMVTPDPPLPGDTRWNPYLDPPVTEGSTGGPLDITELYTANKDMLLAGTNVNIVPNDGTKKIAINSSASSSSVGAFTHLVATAPPYNLSTAGSAASNTTALKACINAALLAGVNVFIPAGVYLVNSGCLTPTLGGYGQGLEIIGEGGWRSILRMATQASESYFYSNSTNGNTLTFAKFIGLGFEGGPVSTGAERANVNPNHNAFRLYGPTDQNFKFFRCRFATLNGVFYCAGSNNASEVTFDNCKITHIENYVWRVSNFQALNLNSVNSDIEIVWGDIVRLEGTGGGAINFTMGSIIIQDDGADSGNVVKLNAQQSATITFLGVRIEVRNYAKLVDGSASTDTANINFISSGTFTNNLSGPVNTVIVNTNQVVNFDKCTFEHNGSYATYTVLGDGWLMFDRCAVRPTLASEITVSSSGTARADRCRTRYLGQTPIDFSL